MGKRLMIVEANEYVNQDGQLGQPWYIVSPLWG